MTMVTVIYGLCTLTALMCAVLLLQAYRRSTYRLLFWAGLFFCIATLTNIFLIVDKLVFPATDLSVYRYGLALLGLSVLLPALIFERE
jgi:hypothetical protein